MASAAASCAQGGHRNDNQKALHDSPMAQLNWYGERPRITGMSLPECYHNAVVLDNYWWTNPDLPVGATSAGWNAKHCASTGVLR